MIQPVVPPASLLVRLGIIASLLSASNAGAQTHVIAPCSGPCTLEVAVVATLGDTTGSGEGFLGTPASVARLADGSFLVADRHDQHRLKQFGAEGAFRRYIGRRGEGPGEFQVLQFVHALPGDSIEVFDLGLRRLTVLAPDLTPVRTVPVAPGAYETVRLADGSRIFAGYYCNPSCSGLPLHHLLADGQVSRSFGARPPVANPRDLHAMYRHVTRGSTAKSVWSAHVPRYRLEEWNLSGDLVRALERRVPWFAPGTRGGYVNPSERPAPMVVAIHRDQSDILWVLIQIADRDWSEGLGDVADPYGRLYKGIADPERYYDSVVEAIDLRTRRVAGAMRVDEAMEGFTQDGLLYGYKEAATGEPYVPIWRLNIPQNR